MLLFFTSGTVSLPEDGPARRSPTASGTSPRRASGTTCGRGTGTGRSPTPAGRRPPGAASSGSGTSAPPSSRSRSASPRPTRSCGSWPSGRITSFCAPPTLYRLLVQADLGRHDLSAAAPLHERRRAAQPGGDPGLAGRHRRPHDLRRLRPVGDDRRSSPTTAAMPVRPGSMGKPVPGLGRRRARRRGRRASRPATVGNVAVRRRAAPGRAVPRLLRRRRGQRRRVPGRLVLHRRQGLARRRRLPLVRGPRRRRDHLVRLPDRAVRGRVGAGRAPGGRRGGGRRPRRSRSGPRSSAPSSSSPPGCEPSDELVRRAAGRTPRS